MFTDEGGGSGHMFQYEADHRRVGRHPFNWGWKGIGVVTPGVRNIFDPGGGGVVGKIHITDYRSRMHAFVVFGCGPIWLDSFVPRKRPRSWHHRFLQE